ncbi:FAD synthetase 1, chloroplastic-like isoform X1 [Rhododendron vialii]|uniref:FAD synthetase 1, chloroplastic-like isoform X1 n=1 Tax=Rhododendron vialii TaxID=182163 RepID=UPI00265F3A74|nr:FAD synthetase 1, chloroplastic-like isoform X1 [Rhododendron vialii]
MAARPPHFLFSTPRSMVVKTQHSIRFNHFLPSAIKRPNYNTTEKYGGPLRSRMRWSGSKQGRSQEFCQREDDRVPPHEGLSSVAVGGVVALGKFDALHIGHRELAIQAAKVGVPFLLSFVGMAEVLGWEPRAPIVAKCDRKRVLSSWAPYCGDITPVEYELEFSKVRHLTPHQFVEMLSKKLGVRGVVAGENYRFGYKAAGDSSELVKLAEEYGMGAYIINNVMDKNQYYGNMGSSNLKEQGQVSSTRVRLALAKGDMKYVSELLGRQHRLVVMVKDQEWLVSNQHRLSARKSCFLNLPPKEGLYKSCSVLIGNDKNVVPCKVTIDASDIHLELHDAATCMRIISQDFQCLGIDFGESGA